MWCFFPPFFNFFSPLKPPPDGSYREPELEVDQTWKSDESESSGTRVKRKIKDEPVIFFI